MPSDAQAEVGVTEHRFRDGDRWMLEAGERNNVCPKPTAQPYDREIAAREPIVQAGAADRPAAAVGDIAGLVLVTIRAHRTAIN